MLICFCFCVEQVNEVIEKKPGEKGSVPYVPTVKWTHRYNKRTASNQSESATVHSTASSTNLTNTTRRQHHDGPHDVNSPSSSHNVRPTQASNASFNSSSSSSNQRPVVNTAPTPTSTQRPRQNTSFNLPNPNLYGNPFLQGNAPAFQDLQAQMHYGNHFNINPYYPFYGQPMLRPHQRQPHPKGVDPGAPSFQPHPKGVDPGAPSFQPHPEGVDPDVAITSYRPGGLSRPTPVKIEKMNIGEAPRTVVSSTSTARAATNTSSSHGKGGECGLEDDTEAFFRDLALPKEERDRRSRVRMEAKERRDRERRAASRELSKSIER